MRFDRRQPVLSLSDHVQLGPQLLKFSSEIGVAAIHLQPVPPTLFVSFPFAYPFSSGIPELAGHDADDINQPPNAKPAEG